jgi:hypothetical protein
VQDARDGRFVGSVIPSDLRRQRMQGTGPAAHLLRNVPEVRGQTRLRIAQDFDDCPPIR